MLCKLGQSTNKLVRLIGANGISRNRRMLDILIVSEIPEAGEGAFGEGGGDVLDVF
jgi:hypothetical protein